MGSIVNVTKGDRPPVGAAQDDLFIRQSDGSIYYFNGSLFAPISAAPGGAASGDLTGTYPGPTLDLTKSHTWTGNVIVNALLGLATPVTAASAATLALPTTGNVVSVTGTTNITDMSGPAFAAWYVLQFTNAAPGTVTSGNHIDLHGANTFAPGQNDALLGWWDGANFWEISRSFRNSTLLSAVLGSDVTLTTVNTFVDILSVAQVNRGVWNAVARLQFAGTAGDVVDGKLWDGTTVIASAIGVLPTNGWLTMNLAGRITTPVGNIKVSARDETTGTTPKVRFNLSGNSQDTTLMVTREA